jgi:hypothetical protein
MKLIQVEKKKGTDADLILLSDQQIQLGNIRVDTLGKGIIGDETVLTATLILMKQKPLLPVQGFQDELISSGLRTREII